MTRSEAIDQYIAGFEPAVQEKLEEIRVTIAEIAPDAEETINYGIPTFKLNGNLVHFAGYKKHVGFYPAPSGIKHFAEQLQSYKGGKGSVQFPVDEPLPIGLIQEIVRFRLEEQRAKK